jgi:glycosyltransferase involved in cell wall biosynthesis
VDTKGNNNPSKDDSLERIISAFFYLSIMNTVTIVCSTREIDPTYVDHVKKHFSHPKNEFFFIENKNEKSLSKLYNECLEKSQNDVVIFIHDDLIFETRNITPKILKIFDNTEYGIIGLAGTDNLITGMWWEDRTRMYGSVGHIQNGKKHINNYSNERFDVSPKEVVVIDGLFMAVNKKRIKNQFNEEFDGFHFYDLPICVENFLVGVKVGVTTKIKLTHKSVGEVNKKWVKNKYLFEALYEKHLPLKIK